MKPLVLRNREINMNTENNNSGVTTRKRTAMKCLRSNNTKADKNNNIEKAVLKNNNPVAVKKQEKAELEQMEISNKENEPLNYEYLLNDPFIWPKHSEIVQEEQKYSLLNKIITRREIVRMHYKDNIVDGVPDWFITRKTCNNEFMHAEYLVDIIDYLNECEIFCGVLGRHFLENSFEISPRHRYIFVNWLVDAHSQFSLCAETLYLAISLSDRFIKTQKLTLVSNDLIIIGIVCLFIAAKVEEVWPPSLNEIVSALTQDYTEEFCRELEIKILTTIDFKLAIPMPISFIRHYNFLFDGDHFSQYLSRYFCELSLQDYEASGQSNNLIGASCVFLAQIISKKVTSNFSEIWNPKLQAASGLVYGDFKDLVKNLGVIVHKQATSSKFRAITQKYSREDLMNVPSRALNSEAFRSLLICFRNETL